jgi:hypothetical protein
MRLCYNLAMMSAACGSLLHHIHTGLQLMEAID